MVARRSSPGSRWPMKLPLDGAEPRMAVEDVGRAVSYMSSLPLEANVLFMTVMATKMPLIGRG